MPAYQHAFQLPNRQGASFAERNLLKLDTEAPAADTPERLPRDAIREEPNLFQPRFDSIAYAPGRSEAHVAALAKIVRAGQELDPVSVVAFGPHWYLVDGHHRLAAYGQAGWKRDIPVRALHSSLRGPERVAWAIKQSVADNKKDRLNMATADKVDAAWQAIAHRRDGSKAAMVLAFGVSDGLIANMRRVRKELEELHVAPHLFSGWRNAQNELRRLKTGEAPLRHDQGDVQRRRLARRLAPVMEMRPSAMQLAEALEAFSPGIVEQMILAQTIAQED